MDYKDKILFSIKRQIKGIKNWNSFVEPDVITKEKNKYTSNPILAVRNCCQLEINMKITDKDLALKILDFIKNNNISIINNSEEVGAYEEKISLEVIG